jgi:hypothetical protein
VSSEKRETAADPGGEEERWLIRVVTVTVVAGGYRAVPESVTAMTWKAKSITALRFKTCGRLYSENTLLEERSSKSPPLIVKSYTEGA